MLSVKFIQIAKFARYFINSLAVFKIMACPFGGNCIAKKPYESIRQLVLFHLP